MPSISKGFTISSSKPDGLFDDSIEFPEPTIPIQHCDQSLGYFMRAWSQLEFSMLRAVQTLLGIDELRSHIVMQSVQQAAVRDLLRDTGSFYLNPKDQASLNTILDQIKGLAGVRNKLVHGNWGVHLTQDPNTKKVTEAVWSRDAFVTDGNTLAEMLTPSSQKGKSLRAKHHFSPTQIMAESEKVASTAKSLDQLTQKLDVRRNHPKEHRSQRRRAAQTPKKKSSR